MLTEIGGMIMAPDNVYDLTWLFFSTVSVFLMTAICIIVWWWARRMCEKMDSMNTNIAKLYTAEKVNEVTISTHIKNDGVHCKGVNCVHAKAAI